MTAFQDTMAAVDQEIVHLFRDYARTRYGIGSLRCLVIVRRIRALLDVGGVVPHLTTSTMSESDFYDLLYLLSVVVQATEQEGATL
jgi:hypothetical protein